MILPHILMGSETTGDNPWSRITDRTDDIALHPFGSCDWSVRVNVKKVGPGTVAWVYRFGEEGHIAGVIKATAPAYEQAEAHGKVWYLPGILFPLPQPWQITHEMVQKHGGWSGRAPFGPSGIRRFANGEALSDTDARVLLDLLHPLARGWLVNPEAA